MLLAPWVSCSRRREWRPRDMRILFHIDSEASLGRHHLSRLDGAALQRAGAASHGAVVQGVGLRSGGAPYS